MSWPLFDRIRNFARSAGINNREQIFQNQPDMSRLISSGDFINFSQQRSLLEQTNLQINRLERYKDFDQMDEVGEIHLALDIYSDEASLRDSESHHSISVKSGEIRVKRAIEDFLYNTLMVDAMVRPWVRYLCKYGDCPGEIVLNENRSGVASVRHMNIYNFTRIETKYGDLVGFYFHDEKVTEPIFLHPWQVVHLRLDSLENTYRPYGRSIIEGARKHFKQLRLMEDAALIYRITRAPEKRVFTIPVGNIPAHEVPGYMNQFARTFKKKQFFDPASGDVNERWNPLIQEDDFWMPQRPDGSGPSVDVLPGAQNLDEIADIEYFKKKMVAATKIPFSRVGIGEAGDSDSKPLSQTAPEFAKAAQWVQNEFINGLKKIIIVDLALKGFSADSIRNFELQMTASSAIDELYRIESWVSRFDAMGSAKELGLLPDRWIIKQFTNMTDDEIDRFEEEKKVKIGEGGGEDQELNEDKLLSEYVDYVNNIKNPKIEKYNSEFDGLMNRGEFDGLKTNGSDGSLLVEHAVDEKESELIKEQVKKNIIMSNDSILMTEGEEIITDDDLPV